MEPLFLQHGWQSAWLEFARPLQLLSGQLKCKVNLKASPVGEGCPHPCSELF